ncbi:hypothetical protein AXF42_Ash010241 [Apostasia shenzhenica]|uniref:DUF632 domain-containing protein n=1 Tax=Apostasia shenzhenica TaxID=1088818 RepID=A0A2I0AA01_9ASPA|nr:hypothetical protein AXF42_Ash010241 [Apostasia shenzhenica]
MGCVHSRVDKEETVMRCRERRRLMKQLLSCRSELAAAYAAYLQSLRNTGATLRQFSEAETVVAGSYPRHHASPPSPPQPPPPPPPLPPSPPLPSQFSTCKNVMVVEGIGRDEEDRDDSSMDIGSNDDDDDCCTPPPPPVHGSVWDFWDPFGFTLGSNSSSSMPQKKDEKMNLQASAEEENWAETVTEFAEEEEENEGKRGDKGCGENLACVAAKKLPARELVDDGSSAVSRVTKETDMGVVAWRSKKTLSGIVKEIDDYFLKAAAGGSDLLVIMDFNGQHLQSNFNKTTGRTLKSAKVLSWNWSLKPQSNRGDFVQNSCDSSRPSNHQTTLERIFTEEEKLYKEVKEDELAKIQLKKMISLLERLETAENGCTKSQKLQSDIEILKTQILSLQESISETCMSISKLRDEELYPQLLELTLGLLHMWRTMYECHQVQNHIAQQANLLDNHPGTEPTTDSHRFATSQLENEVKSWHTSFCNLLKSQREYAHVLDQWVKLTDCLPHSTDICNSIKGIHSLCEDWKSAIDKLPDKVAADAIQSFLSVVHSIILQQDEELRLQNKSKRLESRLEKELNSINQELLIDSDQQPSSNYAKLDSLKKRVEEEKARYLYSISVSRSMSVNNLHTSLPNVFQALVGFSNVWVQALEAIHRSTEAPMDNF